MQEETGTNSSFQTEDTTLNTRIIIIASLFSLLKHSRICYVINDVFLQDDIPRFVSVILVLPSVNEVMMIQPMSMFQT